MKVIDFVDEDSEKYSIESHTSAGIYAHQMDNAPLIKVRDDSFSSLINEMLSKRPVKHEHIGHRHDIDDDEKQTINMKSAQLSYLFDQIFEDEQDDKYDK